MNKTDIIVVGAGPAGISAAVSAKRAGKSVVLIERGSFAGSKNVFGGAIYSHAIREIFENFDDAPLESLITEHKYMILGEKDSTTISYHASDSDAAYVTNRAKFDRWMAQKARQDGVTIVEQTVVRELIKENKRVIGVKTELEDYFADVVIIADGVNSLLTEQIGLRGKIEPQDVALSVKEVFKTSESHDTGCVYQIIGGPMLGKTGMGFIYTGKNTISIGLGVALDDLIKHKIKPYELLDELKSHPSIAPILKEATLLEYSAHMIPEGGYKKMPKLHAPGVLVAGDAAMLVNNVHWEGTNLAMISGKIAGEAAASGNLKQYKKLLKKSFVMKDLHTYREVMSTVHSRADRFLGFYPRKVNEFFKMFTTVDGAPKRGKYRKFVKGLFGCIKDLPSFLKLFWSVMFW